MLVKRRSFLSTVSLGFAGLRTAAAQQQPCDIRTFSYGPLREDPAGIIDLPEGFSYHAFSRTGERLDDGYFVPSLHDGMGAFRGPDGMTILVRNHEVGAGGINAGPFLNNPELYNRTDKSLIYDPGRGVAPSLGGTTTLVYDTKNKRLVRSYLSSTGMVRNCAGGETPWGTWITCEETNQRATGNFEKDHGYNFEIPARMEMGIEPPRPLIAMGRFNHEAIAVDVRTSIVYQTEDRGDGLFYRYIPSRPNSVIHGGNLQALAIRDRASFDTRNYTSRVMPLGQTFDCYWVDIEDVTSPNDNLRAQGFAKGAARFSRGEGIWASREGFYFACTDGGQTRKGQIFRYVPSPFEGRCEEERYPGKLELFVEPNDGNLIDNADNLTVAPWGDIYLTEDGPNPNFIVGVTPRGEVFPFGRNRVGDSAEMAGACFSPDGTTLFVNIQTPGITLAITGPWERARG
ncbi:MAG: PhoX family protein [Bryobacteraceae bacterium]|nr:PhoX family protein [Bryobacteraceae bacterium]